MKKKTTRMSVTKYATEYRDPPITRQAVLTAIRANYKLPGVIKVEKVGNQYVLEVEAKTKE